MARKERPIKLAEPISQQIADSMGFEHLETAFEKEPTGLYLRIYLDKEGGITLNDCEAFHRAVQPRLERIEYDFLEVCSAGIDRPIKTERDARKAVGQEVEIKLFKPIDGQKVFTGIFLKVEEDYYYIDTATGEMRFHTKDVALASRTVDLSVLEDELRNEEETETR
ncbi:MAG: ribosome maturation factor RimP [Clostridiales bacterium]|nr:ribosome maturation factor RimP [Clostridiales bacterium]